MWRVWTDKHDNWGKFTMSSSPAEWHPHPPPPVLQTHWIRALLTKGVLSQKRNEHFFFSLQFGFPLGWVGEGLGFECRTEEAVISCFLGGVEGKQNLRAKGIPDNPPFLSLARCCPAVFLLSVIFSCLFCSHPLALAPLPPADTRVPVGNQCWAWCPVCQWCFCL